MRGGTIFKVGGGQILEVKNGASTPIKTGAIGRRAGAMQGVLGGCAPYKLELFWKCSRKWRDLVHYISSYQTFNSMSTGVSFTLQQDGQKSGQAMPPVRKVERPLALLCPPWFHRLCSLLIFTSLFSFIICKKTKAPMVQKLKCLKKYWLGQKKKQVCFPWRARIAFLRP